MKYKSCPNCGKKGFFKKTKNTIMFEKDCTHLCKYCDMEFKLTKREGELVWRGNIPKLIANE